MAEQTAVKNFLLDSHAFFWAVSIEEFGNLSMNARAAIESRKARIFVSSVSAYELANKYHRGKLPEYESINKNLPAVIETLGAEVLPVSLAHAETAALLDWEHRDPFDRMLVAQAHVDGLVLITKDACLRECPHAETLW
ncbi:MAG: type II toxin-antitoxin system VapC family toxin [Clostridiales Family XIII bacterium]|jgi:PIN domain nuclease of toxin-antitoxin system|nr:type II toxin-antitoxin system VapC family toxin [Clostridiales Family XIII bacterium]